MCKFFSVHLCVLLFHYNGYKTYFFSPPLCPEGFLFQTIDFTACISLPLPSSRREKLFLFQEISQFMWERSGSLQSPERKVQERNNSVFLAFSHCPKHCSIADIDKISSEALVNQAIGFFKSIEVILAFKILVFFSTQNVVCYLCFACYITKNSYSP